MYTVTEQYANDMNAMSLCEFKSEKQAIKYAQLLHESLSERDKLTAIITVYEVKPDEQFIRCVKRFTSDGELFC